MSAAPGLAVLASGRTSYWHSTLDVGNGLFHGPASTCGAPAPFATHPTADRTAPVIGRLSIRPRAFRVARRGRGRRRSAGAVARYGLSEAATVRFAVERAVAGRRVRGRCVRATRRNRSARRCTRYARVPGGFQRAGRPQVNSVRFTGRLGARWLARGGYRLVAVALDPTGNRSGARRVTVRVVR